MAKDLNRTKMKGKPRVMETLAGMRNMLENVNRQPDMALRGPVYSALSKQKGFGVTTSDGVHIGYKIEEVRNDPGKWTKVMHMTFPQPISDMPEEDFDSYMVTVLEALFDKGQDIPEISQMDGLTVRITQRFMPLILVERKPRIVSHGPLVTH